jgi:O-antigen ligase
VEARDVVDTVGGASPPTGAFPSFRSLRTSGLLLGFYAGLTVALTIVPRKLTPGAPSYTGIAQGQPLTTYTIAIVATLLFLITRRRVRIALDYLPLLAFLAIMTPVYWGLSSVTSAGLVHFAVAVAALLVGTALGADASSSAAVRRMVALVVLAVVILQLAISALQLVGLDLLPLDPDTAARMGSRVHGTINHPNNLGKALLLLTALVLPLTDEADRRLRIPAFWAAGLAGLVIAMTVGRANIVAFVILVVLYSMIRPTTGRSKMRYALPLAAAVAMLPFLPVFIARLREDPGGGSRGHMTKVALDQIMSSPFLGIGPNNYVHVVGQHDRLTASGLPVHNSYLLAIAEIGLIGALLIFGPMLVRAARAWRRRREPGPVGWNAATLVALTVALVVVVATGWAMLSTFLLPLWMFVLGYLDASRRTGDEGEMRPSLPPLIRHRRRWSRDWRSPLRDARVTRDQRDGRLAR